MRLPSTIPYCAVVLGASLLLGCPNPNLYGTPRTVPAGKDQHTIALEGMYITAKTPTVTTSPSGTPTPGTKDTSIGLPMFPTYMYRRGISDEVDFGVRIANLSSLGADVKWNFVKSTDVDLAVDPGFQWFGYFTSDGNINVFYFHVPLLIGINAGDNVTVVASPGFVYALGIGSYKGSSGQTSSTTGTGVLARLGLGVQFRLSDSFAIMPEVGAMRSFNSSEGLFIVGGLGFSFGRLPRYKEKHLEETTPATPAPTPTTSGPTAPAPGTTNPPPAAGQPRSF